jgi:hypothetical protein
MEHRAYWISPDGTIAPVHGKHIQEVINNPERFGLTRVHIESVYKKYGEPLGLEGRAREEIMCGLIKAGWIRCRYKKQDYWMVQAWQMDDRTRENVGRWTDGCIKGKCKDTEIVVDEIRPKCREISDRNRANNEISRCSKA